jgi:hypothetical protein
LGPDRHTDCTVRPTLAASVTLLRRDRELASDNLRATNEVTRIAPRLLPSERDEDPPGQTAHAF